MMASENQTSMFDLPIKSMSLEATVIRADGTVEELGTVSYYHEDPEEMAKVINKQGIGEITLCA